MTLLIFFWVDFRFIFAFGKNARNFRIDLAHKCELTWPSWSLATIASTCSIIFTEMLTQLLQDKLARFLTRNKFRSLQNLCCRINVSCKSFFCENSGEKCLFNNVKIVRKPPRSNFLSCLLYLFCSLNSKQVQFNDEMRSCFFHFEIMNLFLRGKTNLKL